MKKITDPLTVRERLTIKILLWVVAILKPMEYEHQQMEWIKQIREELDSENLSPSKRQEK